MIVDNDISIHLSCQQFESNSFKITEEKTVLMFSSNQGIGDVVCPHCGGKVHVYDSGRRFSEDICMRFPGTRITYRAAKWVQELLRWRLPVSVGHEITGFHWDTIRRIHESAMQEALDFRRKELKDKDYRPEYLAIDEFAIHKGHRYATCVIDLTEGNIIWVGRGRSKADFARFFMAEQPVLHSQELQMDIACERGESFP